MTTFDEGLQQAADYLARARVLLDDLDRGVAVAQEVEDTVERSGRTLAIAGAVAVGAAVLIGGALVVRRILMDREADLPPRLPLEDAGPTDTISRPASPHAEASRNGD